MPTKIFVNLPVNNLDKSVEFFTKLSFAFNPQFTDKNSTCMIINDEAFVMLLVKDFFNNFTKKQIIDTSNSVETILSISCDSKEQVVEFVAKAMDAGATKSNEPIESEFMYGESFQDLDGHLWEVLFMDVSKL